MLTKHIHLAKLLIIVLALYAAVGIVRDFTTNLIPQNGYDFYSYWYPIQFIRQGILPLTSNPDEFAQLEKELKFPLRHMNGETSQDYFPNAFGKASLWPTPLNTPLYLWVTFPLGFLTWTSAKLLWVLLNLFFALLIILLTFSLQSRLPFCLTRTQKVIAGLLFLCFLATRNVIGNGQTSLLIFLFMLGSIWLTARKQWLLGGMLLGVALSKYTLAIPVVLYFILNRQWKILLVATLAQIVGFVALSLTTGTALANTILAYMQLVTHLSQLEGINISAYFSGSNLFIALGVTGIFSLLTWLSLHLSSHQSEHPILSYQGQMLLFSLAICWSLLFIYHRLYDAITIFFVFVLLIQITNRPSAWGVSEKDVKIIRFTVFVTGVILCLPGTAISPFLPGNMMNVFLQAIGLMTTLAIVAYSVLLIRIAGFYSVFSREAELRLK